MRVSSREKILASSAPYARSFKRRGVGAHTRRVNQACRFLHHVGEEEQLFTQNQCNFVYWRIMLCACHAHTINNNKKTRLVTLTYGQQMCKCSKEGSSGQGLNFHLVGSRTEPEMKNGHGRQIFFHLHCRQSVIIKREKKFVNRPHLTTNQGSMIYAYLQTGQRQVLGASPAVGSRFFWRAGVPLGHANLRGTLSK